LQECQIPMLPGTMFRITLNGLHPSLTSAMVLPVDDRIPFIGIEIIKNREQNSKIVYRMSANTGLRCCIFIVILTKSIKKYLLKTMMHRAYALFSTTKACF